MALRMAKAKRQKQAKCGGLSHNSLDFAGGRLHQMQVALHRTGAYHQTIREY